MSKHQFQAEIGALLKLMTHSLYSNREIFLRELISNASDALDKFHYLHLTDDRFKEEEWQGNITVKVDEEDGSLTVGDNGIGMNEEDLIANLGTIARSGTKAFLEQLTGDAKKDSHLIGQFGVGFYSVFMVADHVDVITKKAGEDQAYKFSTDGTGEFEIKPVIKEAHGTVIYIKLKEDAKEFLNRWRTKEIIQKYSNHIAYPIYLSYLEEKTEGEGEEAVTKKEWQSEKVNEATALWTLPKSELKEEDYIEFYKTISHDSEEPLVYMHNRVEGNLEYTTLFYIPNTAPLDIYHADFTPGVKLYVKRVFITDDEKALLPSYLRFVRGIIDSEDLPLNVSREILQENRMMATIRQASVKRILGGIKKLESEKFDRFISQYNRLIKEGIFTDMVNKETLLEIVRYKSSACEGLVSLDEYISRGNSEKKEIYYIIGNDENVLRHSPLLEAYKQAGLEVLIMDDYQVDSVVTPMIGSFKEWDFVDITTVDAPANDNNADKEALDEEYKPILETIKAKLGDEVKEVRLSTRLVDSPACVVKDMSDPMASMAVILQQMGQDEPDIPLILEVNPKHALVQKIAKIQDDSILTDVAHVLFDTAKIAEGMDPNDKAAYAKRVLNLAQRGLTEN